ncbi:MAG: glycoside hydrolase family 3 C-terminal domain-containing protein [Ancrocorticia sp.]|nr:glycoside hydrolase family 3 C-terminal domain-containing protein [Ancrocorticia sp.]MCI2193209.1 glycoside hydrolase family 3 C-terminal domain-containing protein [Ancrocorticia sp.]MCI2199536.1 glycoside hydrolase family 3 C-terminal domain-containing protein [Ancrocorticia sp.]
MSDIWNDPAVAPERRADDLLRRLSVEEKIHQLGSYWMRDESQKAPSPSPTEGEPNPTHDVAPMESDFAKTRLTWEESIAHGLGQLTRVFGSDPVSVPEGVAKLVSLHHQVLRHAPYAIPALPHEECLTGFTALGATVYPAAIAWAAAWRPELVEEMANAIGSDLRAVGVYQGLAPLLDVVRDYRWGRVEETCGEDPYLVGTTGTAYVRGLQSAGVIATPKHFVAYPASRAGRNHAPVPMGRRELEEYMLPSFEMAVREGGAHSIMNSYADIDGEPPAASRRLLTEILRERWGFTGTVVSDYWAIPFLHSMHRVAPDLTHAGALALRAGMDVELPEFAAYSHLAQAIDAGLVTEAELDRAVRRVLVQKIECGLLDPQWSPEVSADAQRDLDSPRNRAIARRMAEESVILLKNDGALPLSPARRVAVIGPSWGEARSFMGCYSFPNHVLARDGGKATGLAIKGLGDAFREYFDAEPSFVRGTGFTEGTDQGIAQAAKEAAAADVAIVTVGDIAGMFGTGTSGEGCDVVDLGLPGRQGELLNAVLNTGTPVVLILITGRPYALGEYADRCSAILQAFMPGVEGADAITGVISGRLNPSGRLPIAIPATRGGQPGTYLVPPLGWISDGISNLDPRPLYPFGYGLSFTEFALTDARISAPQMVPDGSVEYSVTATNIGERAGADVVQLYLSDPWAEVVRPLKQLIGYKKVDLASGESVRLTFTVHADRCSFIGRDYNRIVEPGEIQLAAGHSSEHRLPALSVEIVGERRIVPEGRVLVTPVRVEHL